MFCDLNHDLQTCNPIVLFQKTAMKQGMILLHGLFGALSNWNDVIRHFESTYDIHVPPLPIYDDRKGDGLENMVKFLEEYIEYAELENLILVGNSLGGHVAIIYAHRSPEKVDKLILTGSSGLYENTSVGSYVKRGNLPYIRERVAYTFYDPAVATDALVAEVFRITTDNKKCFAILKMAKSAQRNYVADILPQIQTKTLLVWGQNDNITPVVVAMEFKRLLPKADLFLLENCGHAPMMERSKEFNKLVELFLYNPDNEPMISQVAHSSDSQGRRVYY
jgi:pimeloyl-ACP methyl ester carboxylesterase